MSIPLSTITGIPAPLGKNKPWDGLVLPSTYLGLEIEVEGYPDEESNCIYEGMSAHWQVKGDNSLRNGGLELVFRRPLFGKDVKDALENMEQVMEENPPQLSERCSVHVHVDVRDLSINQLIRLILIYTLYERAIVKYHGSSRETNVFCLPFYIVPNGLSALGHCIQGDLSDNEFVRVAGQAIRENSEKYSALNLRSMFEFGSVEFRHMPGTVNKNKILEWINIILSMKAAAEEMEFEPGSFYDVVRDMGLRELTSQVFKDYEEVISYQGMYRDIMLGLNLVREILGRKNLESVKHRLESNPINEKYYKYYRSLLTTQRSANQFFID